MIKITIAEILAKTETEFKEQAIDNPRLTAEMLLAHVLKLEASKLCLHYHKALRQKQISQFNILVRRRLQHEPTAYILGEKGFFESDFIVTQDVLIPRPETEILVEEALGLLQAKAHSSEPMKILELGTGSGAVIISLAKAGPGHQYFANDIALPALDIAIKNADKIIPEPELEPVSGPDSKYGFKSGQIHFFLSNWFSALRPAPLFDLIISNPPYIPSNTISTLAPEIYHYEPLIALDGGEDGLDSYRLIFDQARHHLIPGGTLLLETGSDQQEGIKHLLECYSDTYEDIEFINDLAGLQRIVKIRLQL